MNFNYDLATWLDYFIGAFICCLGTLFVGKILLKISFKEIEFKKIILLLPLTIFTIFNTLAFDNILKIFGSLMVVFIINRYILNEKSIKAFFYSFITYVILMLGELVYGLLLSLFDYIFYYSITEIIAKTIYTNIVIALFSSLIAYFVKDKVSEYIRLLNKSTIFIVILQGSITAITIISLINYLYIEQFKFSYKFILITITIIGSLVLTLTLFKQYLKNKEVVSKYNMLEEYLKTSADLIEKYSSTLHKYKNNLIVIKGYLKNDVNEANKYIDNLLDKIEDTKYSWVKKINYISIDSIRYMIYYKLSQAEEMNLKIYVNVSKDVKLIKYNVLNSNELGHILDILGEYFDNAIYASSESNEKELNFDLYVLNNQLIFNIANSFKGTIDINVITRNGFTTKGKGHGFGLYDIEKTIKNNNFFSSKYEIIDNFFITKFMIYINKKTISN